MRREIWRYRNLLYLCSANGSAQVAELVDALVSGASVQKTCRFESCPGHSTPERESLSFARDLIDTRVVKLVDTLL